MTAARHLEFLFEEPSMESVLPGLLPQILRKGCSFEFRAFQGNRNILKNINNILYNYRCRLPTDRRLVVVLDRDDAYPERKTRPERAAADTDPHTRSQARGELRQMFDRIVIEELETWYFGDREAVRRDHPRIAPNIAKQARHRNPDAIRDGTWDAFARITQNQRYFQTGLGKIKAARTVALNIKPAHTPSRSFTAFHDALTGVTA